jgi:hypothetical protein
MVIQGKTGFKTVGKFISSLISQRLFLNDATRYYPSRVKTFLFMREWTKGRREWAKPKVESNKKQRK